MINQYTASLGNGQYLINLDEYISSSYQSTSSFSYDLNLVRNEFSTSLSQLSTSNPNSILIGPNFSPDITIVPDSDNIKEIRLRELINEERDCNDFGLIDKSGSWQDTSGSNYFPKLKQMISNLPFKGIGRTYIIYSEDGTETPAHIDHDENWRIELMWINIYGDRKIYAVNQTSTINWYSSNFNDNQLTTKTYMTGSACWFDSTKVKGTTGSADFTAGVRIDGEFTSEFREKIFNDSEWETVYHTVDEEKWETDPKWYE